MPSVERVFSTIDPLTADFVYIRLLGDRKARGQDYNLESGHRRQNGEPELVG